MIGSRRAFYFLIVIELGRHIPDRTEKKNGTMAEESSRMIAGASWKSMQVYLMAGVCLAVGLALGYLFRGSESSRAAVQASSGTVATANPSSAPAMSTLEQMRQTADKQAAPLLEKLKTDPGDAALLNQIGTLYRAMHQFHEASGYYTRALQADPKNVAARSDLASCLYYQGDVDGALRQLQQALQYDPKDANSLFNLGMIRWQGKQDAGGAVTAWQELLKSNPTLAKEKKAQVQKLIAEAKRHSSPNMISAEEKKE